MLLWLWHRLAAAAPIQILPWEPPHAACAASKQEREKEKKEGKKEERGEGRRKEGRKEERMKKKVLNS